ncbi:uncharacterized protein [Parasteatoda tepidariorum]|uniref:uncharacterized protein n=1 Tax=Parasteatoda tepidariorum TaxID=114398 RepID=UPI001C71EDEB|nr:uncharacterized protein LOC107455965 [Parasteatoda tepidariorum]
MFSQLCRARPRTLWDKFSVRPSANSDHRNVADEPEHVNNSEPSTEDIRCQLEHCTFCDYRVCCGIVAHPCEELTPCNWELKVTENPAYGLSVKNWLEINGDDDNDEQELLNNLVETINSKKVDENLSEEYSETKANSTSQEDCDANTDDMNQFNISHQNAELNPLGSDPPKEKSDSDSQKVHDTKHSGVSWSVLKHRQTSSSDNNENCDKLKLRAIDPFSSSNSHLTEDEANDKYRRTEKAYPISVVKPIAKMGDKRADHACHTLKADLSRQKPIDRSLKNRFQTQAPTEDQSERLKKAIDPLSEISQIKTEESIQEWLARINVSGNNPSADESKDKQLRGSAWDLRNDETKELKCKQIIDEEPNKVSNLKLRSQNDTSNEEENISFEAFYTGMLEEDIVTDTTTLLCNASKVAPANIPMVVMQCSRLHSHIGSKPPFQQTSLPMGTLVTALYQESEWLYVQTPHGVEGFLSAANCAPIGTINEPAPMSRRPWEPCDFPIRIRRHKKEEFVRQQAAYIQTKLPINGNKESIPYVSTVKMKTNFYTDRYFSNTFKSKDSIKIAKTVTDILRSSPETKISH